MTRPRIGFAGLTHLGLVSAVGAASKGFDIVGYDGDKSRVASIEQGKLPVLEPDLDDLFAKNRARLTFSSDAAALAACDLVYIATDVPTDDRGESDLSAIVALIDSVAQKLGPQALLVVLCQVPPGFTRQIKLPPAQLYYQVETLVFGRAVERATLPERFIVGCPDPDKPLPAPYEAFLKAFGCPILKMRYESAELAKIAINCCLVASVSVANTLADLSERIGADWHEIAPALKLDKRIGAFSYLAPGLGIAGGNLERDLATVLRMAEATGSEASTIAAFVKNSRARRDWVLRVLQRDVLSKISDPVIGVLGLAYKENTHSIKNSPSLALIANLTPWKLKVFDPVVKAETVNHPRAEGAATALKAAEGVDVLAIMTPWPEFKTLKPADIAKAMKGRAVIDPYRVLDGRECVAAGLDYFTLGVPAARATGVKRA
jgi:UDPglucose 6-dehydrogenase